MYGPNDELSSVFDYLDWCNHIISLKHSDILLKCWNMLESKITTIHHHSKHSHQILAGAFIPSEKYEFVSWDDDIPNIWKVIKFHGSKPPTSGYINIVVYSEFSHSKWWCFIKKNGDVPSKMVTFHEKNGDFPLKIVIFQYISPIFHPNVPSKSGRSHCDVGICTAQHRATSRRCPATDQEQCRGRFAGARGTLDQRQAPGAVFYGMKIILKYISYIYIRLYRMISIDMIFQYVESPISYIYIYIDI